MRIIRVRFTIAGLMALVLASGLALWFAKAVERAQTPSIAEQQALASYKQATLVREIAEYAVKEYESSYYYLQDQIQEDSVSSYGRRQQILGEIPLATPDADRLTPEARTAFALSALSVRQRATWKKQVESLKADVIETRFDEQTKLQTYRLEQARRKSFFGF